MYCKKCGLEIQGGSETLCPLCNMPLEENPAERQGAMPDESAEDLRLKEMIADIEGTVKESLSTEEKIVRPREEEFQFDLEKALTEEVYVTTKISSTAAPAGATAGASDSEQTRAAMEQALADIEQAPLPLKTPPSRSPTKNMAAVLLIIGVVAAGIAAGYLFPSHESQTIPSSVPTKKIAPQKPVEATVPAMATPVTPQTQKQEVPAAAESKPAAPPVPPSAEPAASSENVQPEKQEPALPAAEPAKTAGEQQQEAATAPPPVQPPAEVQKPDEPPQEKTAGQPETAKAAAAGFYCVNVGSFKLKDSTDRVCRDLKKNGYAPAVEKVTLSDGSTWYRVTVGSFATRDEAARFGSELESRTKIKPAVVKKK